MRALRWMWWGTVVGLVACGGAAPTAPSEEAPGPEVGRDGWWQVGGAPEAKVAPAPAVKDLRSAPLAAPAERSASKLEDGAGPARPRPSAPLSVEAPSGGIPEMGGLIGRVDGASGLGARGTGLGGGGASEGLGGALGAVGHGFGSGHPAHMRPPQAVATPLRAGRTDDHADWPAFVSFLRGWPGERGLQQGYQSLALEQRAWIEVSGEGGGPLPGAVVSLQRGDELLGRLATHGDGRSVAFPGLLQGTPDRVTVSWQGHERSAAWTGGDLKLELDVDAGLTRTVPIDVVFILDTTGSMGDEIDRIRQTLGQVVERLGQGERPIDLRLGAVLYRDHGDEYLVRGRPLTKDVAGFRAALEEVAANGGGDTPEALNVGLSEAVHQQTWRAGAAKVAFLIADAGPHLGVAGEIPYGTTAQDASGRGVRVHTVAASGLPPAGTVVFRQIAAVTRGQFVFIEYGSTAATAASHGVANPGQVAANNLDTILYERIKAEVDGWGVR